MSHRIALFSFLVAVILTACRPAASPDYYAPGTRVTLTMSTISPEPFQLGPRSSQIFLDMLTNQPVHREISQMPASPMGTFNVGRAAYLWHGNGVIRGEGRDERLWHGSYVQRLIVEVMREKHNSRESVQSMLEALEQDSAVASTPLQGPGQYPGGANDALHPARLTVGDTNGWQVFKPKSN